MLERRFNGEGFGMCFCLMKGMIGWCDGAV